jgi:hypothetical protein
VICAENWQVALSSQVHRMAAERVMVLNVHDLGLDLLYHRFHLAADQERDVDVISQGL